MFNKSLKYSQIFFIIFSFLIMNLFNDLFIEIRNYVYKVYKYLIITYFF